VKPIDEDVTGDVNAVAAYMRDASRGNSRGPEPAPHFGSMSDQELAAYTRSNFGF